MGERGPANKPSYLRVLEGNPSKRPLPKGEIKPPKVKAEDVPPPEWFEAADEKNADWFRANRQRIWNEVTKELAAMGGLATADRQMLILYVDAIAECHRLILKLEKLGDSIQETKTKDGSCSGYKTHPYMSQLIASKQTALKFATVFGMTPSARSRILNPDRDDSTEHDDPFAV